MKIKSFISFIWNSWPEKNSILYDHDIYIGVINWRLEEI